jgi:RNA recognition motif-containing protein
LASGGKRSRLRENSAADIITLSEQILVAQCRNDSMTKMMVHNLSSRATVESLNRLFSEFGAVRSVSLATDIMTGRCGGFGFVHLDEQQTGAALDALNGSSLGGRILRVTFEQKREHERTPIQRNLSCP